MFFKGTGFDLGRCGRGKKPRGLGKGRGGRGWGKVKGMGMARPEGGDADWELRGSRAASVTQSPK